MRLLVLALLLGCANHRGSTNEPVLSGDPCAVYNDGTSCNADAACFWAGTGCACPPNDPSCTCSPGACVSKAGGGGGGGGTGSGQAACVCFNGDVCFEQVGGPVMQTPPQIECALPSPGAGDPCARIQNEGTCTDSTTITGLCICDNGVR